MDPLSHHTSHAPLTRQHNTLDRTHSQYPHRSQTSTRGRSFPKVYRRPLRIGFPDELEYPSHSSEGSSPQPSNDLPHGLSSVQVCFGEATPPSEVPLQAASKLRHMTPFSPLELSERPREDGSSSVDQREISLRQTSSRRQAAIRTEDVMKELESKPGGSDSYEDKNGFESEATPDEDSASVRSSTLHSTSTPRNDYYCHVCDESFVTLSRHKNTSKTHHDNLQKLEGTHATGGTILARFVCEGCGVSYTRKDALQRHHRTSAHKRLLSTKM